MKQVIIATITLAVGVGTAAFIIARSSKRRAHKPMMLFDKQNTKKQIAAENKENELTA